jgi:hypothetical protein
VRIVVSGMVAGVPGQGGATWAVLQYVLGLRRLGHDVVLVEPVDRLEDAAPYFRAVVRSFGLEAALVERRTGRTLGLPRRRLRNGADLLLNISGLLADDDLLERIGTRVFLDLDPAFTQLWWEAEGIDPGFDRHDRFVTVGRAIGSSSCIVPTCGRAWVTTPQPIVLHHWPRAERMVHDAATTVGHWRAYGSIVHGGVHYGQKAHSMRGLLGLNECAGSARFLLALGIHPDERDDLEALDRHGWRLVDPDRVAATPAAYQAFVQGSWAELGIAKLGYVASRCGWFSDRSVCYLASGRPVIGQDTGFSDWLPTGEGLLAFSNVDEAAAALEDVRGDYARHRRAARALAEDVFDSDRVLTRLLSCL